MTVENTFTERLNMALQRRGITQRALSEAAGLSEGYVSHICVGRMKSVTAPIIFRIADALECSARWLATGEED